jgi:hypothetical protein
VSPLILVLSMSLTGAACSGNEAEVPVRIAGWDDSDRAWLEQELARWMSQRERTLCDGSNGLVIELADLEARIRFDFKGAQRTRTLPRAGPVDELFRYETAATAEELVRSTWEAPPPPRFTLLARAAVFPTGAGPVWGGGSIGAGVFVLPSLSIELHAGVAGLNSTSFATVTGALVSGTVSVSWQPLRASVFRAGPRASAQVGALSLDVTAPDSVSSSGVVPWVWLGGGLSAGLEFKRFSIHLIGEIGSAVAGASVLVEGVPALRLQGLSGMAAVQAGWSW